MLNCLLSRAHFNTKEAFDFWYFLNVWKRKYRATKYIKTESDLPVSNFLFEFYWFFVEIWHLGFLYFTVPNLRTLEDIIKFNMKFWRRIMYLYFSYNISKIGMLVIPKLSMVRTWSKLVNLKIWKSGVFGHISMKNNRREMRDPLKFIKWFALYNIKSKFQFFSSSIHLFLKIGKMLKSVHSRARLSTEEPFDFWYFYIVWKRK